MKLTLKVLLTLVALCTCVALTLAPAFAGEAEMAAETEAYVKTTAKDTPTKPAEIKAKVAEACGVLSKEGKAAFPKFQGKGSPFLFDGTYMWIHGLKDGVMLMHPIKFKLNGKKLTAFKDRKGKRFFATMNKVVSDQGSGWVDYYWPIPGSKDVVHKVSFVSKCTFPDGTDVVIGCGIYNISKEDKAKLKLN